MRRPEPNPSYREAGNGPGVVCIHGNASSAAQWRALVRSLAVDHHVLAADSYGSGRSPAWPSGRPLTLQDEVRLLQPVFTRAGQPMTLVGHSYGGAVALVAAVQAPRRVGALVLYEPTLFAWVDAESPSPNEADGIRDIASRALAALSAGDFGSAGRYFIDYWMGPGSWDAKPESQRAAIAATVVNLPQWAHALFTEPTPLSALRTLSMPVMLMIGRDTTAAARAVMRLLVQALPHAEVLELDGLGHMGPVTHPETVNPAIEAFLRRATRA
ncbi:MAG: alpha/beta hydrolase [Burkholderiales bacterium]